MSFDSLEYFAFLPAVFLIHYWLPNGFRRWWLLAASYVFYATFRVPYLPLVLASVSALTFICARAMGSTENETGRRVLLWIGVGGNCSLLIVLKYLPFLGENIGRLAGILKIPLSIPEMPVLVSIGVSFYVFQAISYLLDISLGLQEPERDFGVFSLSLAFFPKLLQGPIERSGDLLPQLNEPYTFCGTTIRAGLLMFTWGLFKKVVIADRLGLFVNAVYDDVHAYTGFPLILATWLYAFQIYFDFSGYTDMALGTARLFNIKLTPNFNSPYLATSIADFWRRWHISFSRWILDYIFKPLQMLWRDRRTNGTAAAIFATFLVSGIWHGATWGFIVWGTLHGIYLAVSVYWKPYQKKLHALLGVQKSGMLKVWQTVVTFNLVSFAWIFFRSGNLNDAWYVITHLFVGSGKRAGTFREFLVHSIYLNQSSREFFVAIICLCLTALVSAVLHGKGSHDLSDFLSNRALPVRWGVYYALVFSIVIFAVYESRTFIYYRF